MRKFIIDTDTASDDAVAIIMALREPSVKVEAVTVVAGNVPLDKAVRNALISIEKAETYQPPVYIGLSKPLIRKQYTAEYVHGEDGLGDVGYKDPVIKAEREHAVDALLRIIDENPGQLELITLGPLTNVAAAVIKSPETMKKLKGIYTMGGTLGFPGNVSVAAEFNIYVDAEAAEIVCNSGIPI
jgi:purine nucleosidase